jgi:hypothetical protein
MADQKFVYALRSQGDGIHWNKVYANPPSKEDVEACLRDELTRHGLDRATGEELSRWVKVVQIPLDEGKCDDISMSDGAHFEGKFEGKREPEGDPAGTVSMGARGKSSPGETTITGEGLVEVK